MHQPLSIMTCPECYATDSRITPLLNPEACLLHHRQYICSTCGRAICADVDQKGRYRAMFPFRSLEVAKLYLRAAEVIRQCPCGIYEIASAKSRRCQFKIFASADELQAYLAKHKDKHSPASEPLFASPRYVPCAPHQLRHLTPDEADRYMQERSNG